MMPAFVPLCTIVIVLVLLAYFFMAAMPFLFVRLDIPEVSLLFRGLFNLNFRIVGITGFAASAVFAASGRIAFAAAMLLLAVASIAARTRVLHSIDTQQSAWQSGDIAAMRRLRLIHCGGMLANVVVLATVAGSLPYIL